MEEHCLKVPLNPITLMYCMYKDILPEVKTQLIHWNNFAVNIPDHELRSQALASLLHKKFHCQGGAVYAAADSNYRQLLIPLIVAFQTISDYLDNLCDRSTSMNPEDFRRLHQSMLDAATPGAPLHQYYEFHPESEDGGYLESLVRTCQSCIVLLPSHASVQEQVLKWVELYCDLQVYKHISHDLREQTLLQWWAKHEKLYPELLWNEFAAATGSTLGVFHLWLAAAKEQLSVEEAAFISDSYFPHICGLHILLDYLIDQEEDRVEGDLNFCNYYIDRDTAANRIGAIVLKARADVADLPHSSFHRMIIEGLLALYLSDPKVKTQIEVKQISKLLMKGSPMTRLFFWLNSIWIRARYNK